MDKPKLLDLFCCAGGATKGYQKAGFYVVGMDIKPQPHYCGDAFILRDAIEALDFMGNDDYVLDTKGTHWYLSDIDAIHASPPCQGYSKAFSPLVGHRKEHPKLIEPIRNRLLKTNKPFVIENVPGSPLQNFIKLNGTMFGLKTKKER